jgi:hypothetical protein
MKNGTYVLSEKLISFLPVKQTIKYLSPNITLQFRFSYLVANSQKEVREQRRKLNHDAPKSG